MTDELENRTDEELHLKDVTEAGELPTDLTKRSSRKKKLVMIGGLFGLLLLACLGGWWLIGGKQVQVKAARRAGEKITSGTDLQKAAYDSLKESLATPTANATPGASAANIGTGQPATISIAGVTPSPAPGKPQPDAVKAPVQSGIAMTIAPPPEALPRAQEMRKPRALESGTQENSSSQSTVNGQSLAAVSKPKTGSSISFIVPKEKEEAVATPAKITTEANGNEKPVLIKRTNPAPNFGAMLPVKLIGVLYTLRTGSMARLELARDIATPSGNLKRGTVFVGTVAGSEFDRAFVQINGFIDPATNSFTKLEGELLGSDGGAGLRGKRRRVSSAWVKVLDRAAQSGTQILTGVLGRRNGGVIVSTDPYGTYRSTSNYDPSQLHDNRTFVEIAAGSVGFVLVTTLPSESNGDSHLAQVDTINIREASGAMPDQEVAALLTEASPTQIRAALPRMSPELRRVAQSVLKEIEATDK